MKNYFIKIIPFYFFVFSQSSIFAQITKQNSNSNASLRAVYALNENVVWASGSNGAVLKTLNGGQTWTKVKSPIDSLDFRDIHVFSENSVIVMSAGEATKGRAKLFQTIDGGETWILIYESKQPGVFFDSFDFWNAKDGILLGDPIDGHAFLLKTDDGGVYWSKVSNFVAPELKTGEATFAASGNSLVVKGKQSVWFATQNRVFFSNDMGRDWSSSPTPLDKSESAGIFGIHFWDEKNGIVVGGDYKQETEGGKNVAFTKDAGKTWTMDLPTKLYGLKESAFMLPNKTLIAVGASGVSTTSDLGKVWNNMNYENYHSISCKGKKCWLVGKNGNIAKYEY